MNSIIKSSHASPVGHGRIARDLMTSAVPVYDAQQKVGDVMADVIARAGDFDTVNYVYLTDDGRLSGVLSMKELLQADPIAQVGFVSGGRQIVSVHEGTQQEQVASQAIRRGIKAVPVVDHDGRFLGVIAPDVIFGILEHEGTDDLFRLAGVPHASAHRRLNGNGVPFLTSVFHRLPWLIVGLGGGMMASVIVGGFEQLLAENLILASFIPLIVYMSDAVGTQMEAFIIRDLAMDESFRFRSYFLRQAGIVFAISLVLSALLLAFGALVYGDVKIFSVVSLALLLAINSSIVTGLAVPYLFSRLRLDPADASGPIATVIQDLASVTVYFLVGSWML